MTFSLTTILVLIAAALVYNCIAPSGRGWFLFVGSVVAIYWLQPFLPIRFSGFILPSLTLLLVTAVWHATRPPEYKSSREDWQSLALMMLLVIALSCLRFLPFNLSPLANRPPNPIYLLLPIGLASAAIALRRRYQQPAATTAHLQLAILAILLLFILLKSEPLAVAIGRFWRTLTQQDPTIATSLDITWLGFSYIAFRLIHTLRDRQTGQLPAIPLREFTTYIIFFPSLIAGPIDRAERFSQDFRALPALARFQASHFYEGFSRITIGLLKKFIIADSLAQGLSLTPTSAQQATSTVGLWLLLYGYAMRLYFDFAGYTDIAIGLGQLFGIKLPENFQRPYRQTSLTAFWQSWHMSLSNWARFYIFSPLSRQLLRRQPRPSPLLIVLISQCATMLAIGLWHGLSLNFLIWGLWHGLGLFLHKYWSDKTRNLYRAVQAIAWQRRLWNGAAWLLTFHYVTLGWLWFLLPSPALALQTFAKLFAL